MTVVNNAPTAGNDIVDLSEFRVNEFSNGTQNALSATELANGNLVVIWTSEDGQQDETFGSAIKARIFDANCVEIVSELLINKFTNSPPTNPCVTALTNGHFVVIWTSEDEQQGDTSGFAIKARVFDANGVEIVGEFLVNEYIDSAPTNPSVTALANGHFAVTWEALEQQHGHASVAAVKARIFDTNGVGIFLRSSIDSWSTNLSKASKASRTSEHSPTAILSSLGI
ncbi:hypothetical protein [uncultured Tateyamaria sp.]|uniref:hypothetical protein n=1 Tax=uncultured Tateyamaria sp. TaxID=455651 RepID=UPI002624CDF0|nr:hypothetical protein [uncultured Tateyamaria sp.]